MSRPNDDLTADPLDDEALAALEAQLRRDVLRNRPLWLGLLARLRAAEHALATVRSQPKRDALAHEVHQLARENAGLEARYAERALAANTAEAYLAQAQSRVRDLQTEYDRLLLLRHAERGVEATAREEVHRVHETDLERVRSAAQLRESDLQAQIEQAERRVLDANAQQTRLSALQDQVAAETQRRERWRASADALRAALDMLFDRLAED